MWIYKMELENITSHKNTTIEFERGLNLLYGPNGSGKSTILNMIGYVLFNFLPSNQKNYVRKVKTAKKKFGLIKIWVAQNDDNYVIKKSIAKAQPLVEVVDARTGIAVQGVSNAVELQEWVTKQFGLPQEIDLKKIFSTSVGVPQGTFTAPFLSTPQQRKDFFNPVLHLDVYRNVFKKMVNIESALKEDLAKVKLRESTLAGRLLNKENLIQLEKEKKKLIISTKTELNKVEKELTEKEKKFSKFKELSIEFNKCQNDINNLKSNQSHVSDYVKNSNDNLENAREADKVCRENKSDFLHYEELIKEKETLEEKNQILVEVNKDLNGLYNKQIKIESSGVEIKKLIDSIEKEAQIFSTLESDYEEFQKLQDLIQVQRDKLTKVEVYEDELENWKNRYFIVTSLVKDLDAEIKQLTNFKKNIAKENSLEDSLRKQGELKARSEQKIEIGAEISKYKQKVNLKSKENMILSNLNSQIEKLELIENKYIILNNKIVNELPNLKNNYLSLVKDGKPIIEKIKPLEEKRENLKEIPSKLVSVNEEIRKIKQNHDKYQTNERLAKELSDIETDCQKNKKLLMEIEKDITILEKNKKSLEEQFDIDESKNLETTIKALVGKRGELKTVVTQSEERLEETVKELRDLEEIEKESKLLQNEIGSLEFIIEFTGTIRNYFNSAGSNITELLLKNINEESLELYKEIMEDPSAQLEWDNEFLIKVETPENIKDFHQLSGGEQMAAAIAVRLAILKVLSNAEFVFFDEPTTNLDIDKRESLARLIQKIIPAFQQIFVISHDDCFEENVDNVIKFTKGENEETIVEYIGKADPFELIWDE